MATREFTRKAFPGGLMLVILLAVLAGWLLALGESQNLWDYLLDTWLWLYALVRLAARIPGRRIAAAAHRPGGGPDQCRNRSAPAQGLNATLEAVLVQTLAWTRCA